MRSYQCRLRETRMSRDETDDVALFDVTCEEDEGERIGGSGSSLV